MTRVIHTGDTHIGYQQYNAPERRRDFLSAFRKVAADAIEADVDAVVHAGDLFHDRRPGLVDLQGTVEVLRDLSAADVAFLAVVGNHEGTRDAQWLDLFADLGLAVRLDDRPHVIDDVAFYGLDFVPRSRREDLAYDFEPTDAAHTALVAHGLFEPFPHADWDTEELLAESTVDFDAVLLGDNHAADTAEVGDAWVTYCGSTERASASERDERGYNLVTFEEDVRITRRGLETREFVFVDVELGEGEGIDRVRERVREYDLEEAVVVVTVAGDGEPITPAAVEEFATERGALIARVNDGREIETETELSVSFADPDEAVRERLRDLGLSEAAREIDRTVRDGDLADANVRETVERRVRAVLEEDPAALRAAPAESFEGRTVAEALADGDGDGGEQAGDGDDERSSEDADDGGDGEPAGERAVDGDGDRSAGSEDESDGDDATAEPAAADDEPTETGEQVSMGDFS